MTRLCPRCGAEMEEIDPVEQVQFQQLRLCPDCYLVAWNDDCGVQARQGIQVKTERLGDHPNPTNEGHLKTGQRMN